MKESYSCTAKPMLIWGDRFTEVDKGGACLDGASGPRRSNPPGCDTIPRPQYEAGASKLERRGPL